MHTTPLTMSARSMLGGHMGSIAIRSIASRVPSIAPQQPCYFSTTSATTASKLTVRPHVRASPSFLTHSVGLRTQSTAAPTNEDVKLDWNSFFKLRTSRRRYSLASSIIGTVGGVSAGVPVLTTLDLESLSSSVMGLDPFLVLGLATAACGAVGWLIGPIVGNGVWGLVNRKFLPSVAVKEKEFFDRIRRFRVDPSTASLSNPIPDYYGEKIGSVGDYRRWLKDQRAYNRKRRNYAL
ncbi:Presequence translocated-associated motor subunit pam17 mitochondrial [Penicillium taxi]|uniref:Presequence translocated-associated motor subunit pam17 mitochondrial n=1 Tax=Penicillium taxi TaxID=168475 RepID=UPI002545AA3A|nr:Presequence translocated-associated motor subunit pam17 mitochondrial [Penicillium taxi]KAJ5887632.1 Presequence translocated-associated motor subunit pam17 mitochondrial [Penicillium taxi]